ncbi:histidine kinase [Galbibacter sp. EGI 63066]|uniref:sensor histidine kinase n=1 Tax=Galbibacter sp. EGI 63066 TaxID=2993559 RepID=UPI002248C994|nr:histidine kinase [Galbibacter sp. EGI 63066]MCX2679072.1 histidine kinase [Galbibacter sp. EGI 63066]
MIKWIEANKKPLAIVAVVSALIPMLITAYELVFKGKEAVAYTFNSTIGVLIILYYVLLIIAGVSIGIYWLINQIRHIIQLKNEKTNMELMHLKAQINPHFFFNILNNLYGLVDKDSEKAKHLILKLSEMMRYSIYEGQRGFVTLRKEISFIFNFIELHKMRYHKNVEVEFIVEAEDEDIKIMPLAFIILVENAFKHGVENLRQNAYVKAKLQTSKENIYFEIENNFDSQTTTEKGLGLKNLKRRLELVYPNRHKLETISTNSIFKAQLTLNQ